MNADELRAIQAPIKQLYRDQPDAARVPARAEGSLDPNDIAIVVDAWHGKVTAGLAGDLLARGSGVAGRVKQIAAAGGLLDMLRAEREANRAAWSGA